MPYYCTVPRCTSMAGKAKNVSFHQFPRDEDLAKLWNSVLKRGKPYTKYSKVCSLHFRPEDYTITSVGKNKGQWRSLRKDAIPSQNLPSESPSSTPIQRPRNSGCWSRETPDNIIDPLIQQQVAQMIYMQTMLAMQAAGDGLSIQTSEVAPQSSSSNETIAASTEKHQSEFEKFLNYRKKSESTEMFQNSTETCNSISKLPHSKFTIQSNKDKYLNDEKIRSFKCEECSKCFKDPDVFILHKRTHKGSGSKLENGEKENFNLNINDMRESMRQETLKSNPILANLLKNVPDNNPLATQSIFNLNSTFNLENQIMAAITSNMKSFIKNMTKMVQNQEEHCSDGENETSEDKYYEDLLADSRMKIGNMNATEKTPNDEYEENSNGSIGDNQENSQETSKSKQSNSKHVIPDLVSDITDYRFHVKDDSSSDCDK